MSSSSRIIKLTTPPGGPNLDTKHEMTASEKLQRRVQNNEDFDIAVKALLQATAKCEYNVCFIADEKESKTIEEGICYVKKNNNNELEYQYIKANTTTITKGLISKADLGDVEFTYKIPELWNNATAEMLLPKIFQITSARDGYIPPLKAEWMAKRTPALIVSKSTFTEEWCAKRKWTQPISPLEYAAFLGDIGESNRAVNTGLVNEFLKILPDEFKAEAYAQLQKIEKIGTEHGRALIDVHDLAGEYHSHQGEDFSKLSPTKAFEYWKNICKKQLNLPVNLLQWFCSSVSFTNISTCKGFPEARNLSSWNQYRYTADLTGNGDFGSICGFSVGACHTATSYLPLFQFTPRGESLEQLALSKFISGRILELRDQINALRLDIEKLYAHKRSKENIIRIPISDSEILELIVNDEYSRLKSLSYLGR